MTQELVDDIPERPVTELVTIQVPDKEEDVLDFTKQQRVRLLETLCENGRVPTDNREQMIMLQTLADMDRAALAKMKIKVDQHAGADQAAAAAVLAKMLSDSRIKNISRVSVPVVETPKLPDEVSAGNVVEGELFIGHKQETYEEFMARTNTILNKGAIAK